MRFEVRRFLCLFAMCFAASGLWALASPVSSGPDETVHVIRGAAFAVGDFFGEDRPGLTGNDPSAAMRVPQSVGDMLRPDCYWYKPSTPASCQQARETLHPSPEGARALSYVGK